MEEQTAHTNKSRVKVANLCIKSEEYKRAVELLEAVSNKAKDNNLGK